MSMIRWAAPKSKQTCSLFKYFSVGQVLLWFVGARAKRHIVDSMYWCDGLLITMYVGCALYPKSVYVKVTWPAYPFLTPSSRCRTQTSSVYPSPRREAQTKENKKANPEGRGCFEPRFSSTSKVFWRAKVECCLMTRGIRDEKCRRKAESWSGYVLILTRVQRWKTR